METPGDQTVKPNQKAEPKPERLFFRELLALLNVVNERLTEIKNRSSQDAFGRYHYTEDDRRQVQELKAKKRQIEDRLLAIQI